MRFHAPRAIVTLPLSVLQLPAASAHSVRFTPELSSKRAALTHLAFGPVIKVVMHFSRPFWADLHDDLVVPGHDREQGAYRAAGTSHVVKALATRINASM